MSLWIKWQESCEWEWRQERRTKVAKAEELTHIKGAIGWQVLGHIFWQRPGALSQCFMQNAHSLRFSLIQQTPRSWLPSGELPMSDSAKHLPGLRSGWERKHHEVHQVNQSWGAKPDDCWRNKHMDSTFLLNAPVSISEHHQAGVSGLSHGSFVFIWTEQSMYFHNCHSFIPWASENFLNWNIIHIP